MIFAAAGLIVFGALWAVIGLKLFRLLLPLVGLISGVIIGFNGVQALFGTGVVSTAVALMVAVIVGLLLAALSYLLYEVALVILAASIGASIFTYLGVAMGLQDNGFILFLLGLSGAILGLIVSMRSGFSVNFVMALTSIIGIGWIFAGVLLLVGNVSLDQLANEGAISAVINTVDHTFIWLFAWLGGTLVATSFQQASLKQEFADNRYEYIVKSSK